MPGLYPGIQKPFHGSALVWLGLIWIRNSRGERSQRIFVWVLVIQIRRAVYDYLLIKDLCFVNSAILALDLY